MVFKDVGGASLLDGSVEEVSFNLIMTHINVTISGGFYYLADSEKEALEEVKQRREKKTRARTRGNPQKRNRRQTQFMEDDGMETIRALDMV